MPSIIATMKSNNGDIYVIYNVYAYEDVRFNGHRRG